MAPLVPAGHDLRVLATALSATQAAQMVKRVFVGFLWTFALYSGWKLGAGLLGAPQYLDLVAMVASASIGSVVAWRWITTAGPQRRVARIPDRAVPATGAIAPDIET